MAMLKAKSCPNCAAASADGIVNVFCPVCAMQGALDSSSQPLESWLRRCWDRLRRLWKRQDNNESENLVPLPAADPGPTAAVPSELGGYALLEKVGGHMGMVFKARHGMLGRVVAVKLLPANSLTDPARVARFIREIRAMGQLSHPNLVMASDAREADEFHLVAMEWIDGMDLQQLVRLHQKLPVAAACEIICQAARGLEYAHEHGFVHRDVKPSNLMLTRSGTVKVIDLGLAHTMDESAQMLTRSGDVLGTMVQPRP